MELAEPILELAGLRKSFGPVHALRGVDMELRRGEVLALVGDNGAGKSTLIKHIAGVYRADAGTIHLAGERIDLLSPREARERGIETVYQDLALADDLSVGANIFLGREPVRRLAGISPYVDDRLIRRETATLLDRIRSRIPPQARTVARLSGGQRQAVAIARAIYWRAKVVIMDEPTAALAVMERENVVRHARELAAGRRRDLCRPQSCRDPGGRGQNSGDVPRSDRPHGTSRRDQPGRSHQVHDRI